MAFCTNCGRQLIQGQLHVCGTEAEREVPVHPPAAASSSHAAGSHEGAGSGVGRVLTDTMKQVDGHVILRLLKNPQAGLLLNPGKDFMYGVLGIAASIVGFLLWGWMVGINGIFTPLADFGGFSESGFQIETSSVVATAVIKIFLMGAASMAAFLASIWLIGSWRGERKLSIKTFITYAGSMHYASGAGFILAGVIGLVNIKLSIFLLGINMLIMLVLTYVSAIGLFGITKERQLSFIAPAILLYGLLLMVITTLFL